MELFPRGLLVISQPRAEDFSGARARAALETLPANA
jgi:hypothetical protein